LKNIILPKPVLVGWTGLTALKIAAGDTWGWENHHAGGGSQGFRARLILFGKHPATRTQYYLEWLREHMDTWATQQVLGKLVTDPPLAPALTAHP